MNPQYQNVLPPPPVKRSQSRFSPRMILLGIGIVLALVVAGSLLMLTNGNKPISQMQRLSARFANLQEIIKLGDKHITNADLKKVHSDASILVTGNVAGISGAMTNAGLEKIPKEITALEADSSTLESLADAQLNGRFDDAYKKALSQKLESTMALMKEIQDKTNSNSLKTSLATGYEHFSGLLDQLAKL